MNAPLPSLADLHERLGRKVADLDGIVRGGDGLKFPANGQRLRALQLECMVRPVHVPPPPDNAFTRALDADWTETEQLLDAARARFRKHRSRERYRAECREIVERRLDAAIRRFG